MPSDTISPLRELTEGSARVAQFKLAMFHPWEDAYKYTWDGSERSSRIFKFLLVDVEDPTWYCHAELKKTTKNASTYNTTIAKFKEGAVFIFKSIAFVKDVKSQYLSASKRDVVNLAYTTASEVKGITQACAVQPCPIGTVSEKLQLQQEQRFDLTTLILTVSPVRDAGTDRNTGADKKCFDVELIDGSTNEAKDKKNDDASHDLHGQGFRRAPAAPSMHGELLACNTAADARLQDKRRRVRLSICL